MRVLAGDIGGTKTRLAVFDVHGTRLETVTERSYPSGSYSGLENIVQDFLGSTRADCRQACFGIAGPVQRGRAQATNLPWVVEEQALAKMFGFERVALINDLEANAWGIGALRPSDFCTLNAGSPDAGGNACIISAGTGLGEAGLYWDGQRHWPFACEGGHTDFSPSSDLEIALLKYLRQRFGRASWERVLSGMGLANVHDFLRTHRGVPAPSWLREELSAGDPAAAISRAARDDRDALCAEALDLSIHLYGVEAGNLALKIMATGGVYLGGGIAPKNLERLKGPLFMQGFLAKGRMQPLLEAMPVKIIINDRTALFGPALYLTAVKEETKETIQMTEHCDIGLIGLAVMGQNLILNMADHGYQVAAYNRTTGKVDEFIAGPAQGKSIVGCYSPAELVKTLKRPRRIMMMVKAGDPVSQTIKSVAPLLEAGDILIDGGNSYFADTEQRIKELQSQGILYIGTGVSGGEEGARHGPSIMPGGSAEAWNHIKPIFQAVAAKVGPNNEIPCCEWIGPGGAGHFVKMIHNGIEYGDMQLICEAYSLLKDGLGLSNEELYDVFARWNKGELDSYLIEITRDIFSVVDSKTNNALVDMILDKAGQKGTGKWTGQLALDLGVPTTLITEAVFARFLSARKEARLRASKVLCGPTDSIEKLRESVDRDTFIESVRQALYASKITSYAQGFVQLQAASGRYDWDLKYGELAMLWRGGCIIRAAFLERIKDAFDLNPHLENLLLDAYFQKALKSSQTGWRSVVSTAARIGISIPATSAALTYYDGYRCERLPHNLLQAQRDYFGAHTYERLDEEGAFHTDWLGMRREPQ